MVHGGQPSGQEAGGERERGGKVVHGGHGLEAGGGGGVGGGEGENCKGGEGEICKNSVSTSVERGVDNEGGALSRSGGGGGGEGGGKGGGEMMKMDVERIGAKEGGKQESEGVESDGGGGGLSRSGVCGLGGVAKESLKRGALGKREQRGARKKRAGGTKFTCFTSTKVQILAPRASRTRSKGEEGKSTSIYICIHIYDIYI